MIINDLRSGLFPRVITRGLIEAIVTPLRPPEPFAFPRVITRGLIEALPPKP